MKLATLGLSLFLAQSSFALTYNSTTAHYINLYSENLLKEFDQSLDESIISKKNPLDSKAYAKLQVIRALKDQSHSLLDTRVLTPLFDEAQYKEIQKEIDSEAKLYQKTQKELKAVSEKASTIEPPFAYPSTTAKGNITGSTFPKNVWALTFDDGPRNVKTEKIIDYLLARNIRATFFMLTSSAKTYKTAALDVRDRGMDVALHSYTHENLPKVSDAKLTYEISTAKKDLESLLDVDIKLFRLPYGSGVNSTKIRTLLEKEKMIHVFWNIDSLDWQDKNPKSVLQRAIKLMNATPNHSGIILFHDIHETSREASRLVVDYLLEKNNRICSVKEVVDGLNGEYQNCY